MLKRNILKMKLGKSAPGAVVAHRMRARSLCLWPVSSLRFSWDIVGAHRPSSNTVTFWSGQEFFYLHFKPWKAGFRTIKLVLKKLHSLYSLLKPAYLSFTHSLPLEALLWPGPCNVMLFNKKSVLMREQSFKKKTLFHLVMSASCTLYPLTSNI